MHYFFLVLIFLLGSALGSFIAVIGARYNTGLSFFKGRSVCFSCNTTLQKKDLIPIFSFLSLGGKCRYCQSKIPVGTLITEIAMGVLTVLAAVKTGLIFKADVLVGSPTFYVGVFQFSILTAIFGTVLLISIYDLKHFIIPDSFLISFFVLSLLFLSFFPSFNFSLLLTTNHLLLHIVSGVVLAIPFLLIFLISKGTWFGFGDVKYIAVLGFFLGFIQGLSAIVMSFWIGAAFSLLALSLKKIAPRLNLPLLRNNLTIKSEIPFGPFLSLGIILSFCLSLDLFQIHEIINIF
jgi:leader peptidase (prepilin peptidase) / N-methyltransferase